MTIARTDAVAWLTARGAATIEHPGGTLLAHLQRTSARLEAWGAAEAVVLAGLCHAAYGTDGFPRPLIVVSQRAELVARIGPDAENLVYAYGATDRTYGLPGVERPDDSTMRDRFTRCVFVPDAEVLQALVDLACANEIDVFLHAPDLHADVHAWLLRCRRAAGPSAAAAIDGLPAALPSP